ncbi:DNRLRE domain-containing protein [Actinomadura sp. GC306]|uniref:DNRLRE domain-containing protein n=1 Tax=Actinomadura sp. GC306 TaxID=2530367 RepID=UPI001405498F|nr:DNRLRE domain-containing protein [Actinomadura sp. GC306]
MRGVRFFERLSNRTTARFTAVVVAASLVLSLGASGNVVPPGAMSAANVETPVQRTGSAKGKSHRVTTGQTAAGNDRTKRMPRRPKGAPGLEKPHTPKVVKDVKGKRAKPPQTRRISEPEPVEVTGFDPKKSVESPARRTRFGTQYKNPDGTWTAKYNTRPVNYQASDGSWQPIDSTLTPSGNGRFRNKADGSRVDLSARAAGTDLASIELGQGKRFGFGVEGAGDVTGQVKGDSILYQRVRPDADLKLQVLNGASVKEEIVLHSRDAPSEWVFPLRTEGVAPRLAADGSVELLDGAGIVVAHIPHGFMVDSKIHPKSGDAARSDEVNYALEQRGGSWALKVSADREWLEDPDRVYPVTVDPTAVWNYGATHDTYVQTGYGSSPYAEAELKAGTYNGGSTKAATYLAFTQVDNELAYSKVYDVNLNIYNWWSYSCTKTPVTVHGVTQRWAQSELAAYPGPNYGSALTSKSFANGFIAEGAGSSACPAKWQSIDLGSAGDSLVQGWVNKTKPNYGLTVRASTKSSYGWKKFGSRESANGPYLVITYSPYNAAYAFAENPPKVDPPVLNNQAGYVKVKVKNKGHDAWTASAGYRLTYGVFDKSGRQIYHRPAETPVPQTVSNGETVTINTKINPLPPGTWTIKFDMLNTSSGVLFSQWGVPRTAALSVTVPDIPSKLKEMFPKNNHRVGTLRPELFAEAESVDAWPSANVNYQFTICAPPWIDWEWCESSPWQDTPKWTVPAGKLQWGKEYYWMVRVSDSGGTATDSPLYKLLTAVEQPAITSHLASPASDQQEFDHQAGNYTTTVTDAAVANVGPPLSVVRTYNSLDPRTSHAFGAGWTTRFDMKVVPDADGTGNVVVTYPDGQEVRFAKNTDGTFTPPPARQATFAAVTGGGWKLMDKGSTSYLFDDAGKLTRITDHRGRSQNLQYGTDGKLSKVTVPSGRSLSFTWTGGHVTAVSTDPVNGEALTWTYGYTDDTLTKVCPPTSATECTTYEYEDGSHYRSTVLDDNPTSYWRLNESSGRVISSAVAGNLGTDNGGATSLTLGRPGALAGTSDRAVGFNGSDSRVRMPDRYISREGGYLAVEAWFRTTGQGVILSYQNAMYGSQANKYTPALYVGADGKLRGQFWNGSNTNVLTSAGAVNNGQWHHAVLSGQGSSQTLYLDGQKVGTLNGTIDHLNEPYVYIGSGYTTKGWAQTPPTSGWFDFAGDLDEVAIYDRPLGLPAVRAHYDARHTTKQLTKVTKPSGRVQAVNAYDVDTDRLVEHVDANGGTWEIRAPVYSGKVDDLERTIEVKDPRNGMLKYVYEPLRGNRLISETDQLGKTTTYAYDTNGQLGKITDANGNETNLWFDERGNKRYEQRCADVDTCHAQYWNYYLNPDDAFDPRNDQLTQRADGRTVNPYASPYTTVWEYDVHGQQTAELWPATDDYPFRGIAYSYTDGTEAAEGGGTQPAGLLKRRSKANGGTAQTYAYSSAGDLLSTTDAAGKVTRFGYDAIGRVISSTEITDAHPQGVTTTYGYDGRGHLLRVTKPAVENEVSGATHTPDTRFSYDADGNKLTETLSDLTGGDPERRTTYGYNAHGQVETITDPEGGTEGYEYDATGARTKLTDKSGTRYAFAYDLRGQLTTRTLQEWVGNPDDPSPATDVILDSYAYDPGGRLGSHTDAMGRTKAYTYYGDDRLAQVIATGVKVNDSATPRDVVVESRSYDGAGHLVSHVTGGGKHRTDYEYDQVGQLIAETVDPDGAARRTDYDLDPDNNVIRTVRSGADSERQETADYGYDPMDRPVRQSIENGDDSVVTSLTRDQRGLVTQIVDPRGNAVGVDPTTYTTTMRYDAAGQLKERLEPAVQVERNGEPGVTTRPATRYGYNTAGEQTHVTDPEGRTVTNSYDKAGRPVSTHQPSYDPPVGSTIIPTITMEYDAAGRLTEQTDARGGTTRLYYDALGRQTRLEEPQLANENRPGEWKFEYDLAGEQLSATGPTGIRTEATYDDLGRQITHTEIDRYPVPAAYTTELAYDDAGNLTSRTRPAGDSTEYTVSGAGDITAVTNSRGHTTELAYDLAGRLTKVTDPLGVSVIAEFDHAGRQIKTRDVDAAGNTIRTYGYEYDAAGNRISETSPEGHTTYRAYDALDRLTTLTEPVSATGTIETGFGYDATGQRTRLTDGRGNSTITTYNTLGLPEKTIEPSTAAHGDNADRTWTTSYDATGNPVHEAKPGGVTVTRTFDQLNRLTEQTGTGAEAPTLEKRFGYDLAGRRLRISGPVADLLFTYNDRGQLLSSISPGGKTAHFAYDANGRLQQRTDPAGQTSLTWNGEDQIVTTSDAITGGFSTRTYDDAGRLNAISTQNGGNTGTRTYGYDDLDRITSDELTSSTGTPLATTSYGYDLDDRLTEKTTTGTIGAGTNTYAYDRAGRLTQWVAPSGTETDYEWDASGNRTKAGATTYTYDERNRLTSDGTSGYTYTGRGTLKTIGGTGQKFDAFDRLIQEGTVDYRYDALDRIATRTGDSGATNFVYATQENDVTAVTDDTGMVTSGYQRTPDGELLSVKQDGQAYHALSDRHQDLTALYDPAITALAGSTAYDPYGGTIAQAGTGTLLGYQGEYTDPASGRVNMHARWYTPGTGSFASRDDWTLEPDPSVQANRYTYANAAPLNYTDPTGHAAALAFVGLAVALAGALAVSQAYQQNPPTYTWPSWDWSWRWPWSRSAETPYSVWDVPTFPPYSPVTPWRGTGGGGGGGGGTVGALARPGMARPGIARPRPPRPSPAQIQRTLARKARDTYAPRPPSRPGVGQKVIDKIRDNAEKVVKVATGAQNTAGTLRDVQNALEPQNARPDTPSTDGPSTTTDGDDDGCVHKKDYGRFIGDGGYHTPAHAIYCKPTDVDKGSPAETTIFPPGWPQDEHGRPTNSPMDPFRGKAYKYARCHLIAARLGGSGKDPNNLVTCVHNPTNNSGMKRLESQVRKAVKGGQIVDYTVIPIYRRGDITPDAFRMIARGRSRDGAPGISFDKCVWNSPSPINGRVADGVHCRP